LEQSANSSEQQDH